METNPEKHTEILEIVKKFRDEEQEHHDTGIENDAEKVKTIQFHYIYRLKIFNYDLFTFKGHIL